MDDQIILLETAKLAEQQGFKVPVSQVYGTDRKIYFRHPRDSSYGISVLDKEEDHNFESWHIGKTFNISQHTVFTVACLAPTQTTLQKWLRKFHHILVEVCYNGSESYYWIIRRYGNSLFDELTSLEQDDDLFQDYEKALENGLVSALKLI